MCKALVRGLGVPPSPRVHLLDIYISTLHLVEAQINCVCSWKRMIYSGHGRSGSIPYQLQYAGDTNTCRSGQKISQGSIRKVKDTQHNFATSGSQVCMGAKPPYPMESTVMGSSTVLPMHPVKESLYIKLKY